MIYMKKNLNGANIRFVNVSAALQKENPKYEEVAEPEVRTPRDLSSSKREDNLEPKSVVTTRQEFTLDSILAEYDNKNKSR